jgi:hypothetical protein
MPVATSKLAVFDGFISPFPSGPLADETLRIVGIFARHGNDLAALLGGKVRRRTLCVNMTEMPPMLD